MKFLFLPYACAEKFRAAKTGAINVPLSPEASMAEFYVAKREDAMKFLEFFCKRAERGLEILKFLSARHFGLRTTATEFLNLTPAPPRNGFRILKFTPEPLRNLFGILKFALASARLADTAQNFILRNGFKIVKFVCEPLRALHRVLSRANKVEIEVGREEKFSKFDFTNALLNFISLPPRKFKPASAVRLNFALNSVPRARTAKFENGVKFKGAAKFKRGAQ